MIRIEVSEMPLDLGLIDWRALRGSGHGACNVFAGTVRDTNHGRQVVAVAYDAFVPLAERILGRIAREALEHHGGQGSVLIHHRVGKLAVGETSVLIIAHTPHRAEAFSVCREVIEELKLRAPIWKKEYYSDGETRWLQGHALCGAAARPEREAHPHA